mmetsp:Transcript_127/g.164  ORF Transcript_127/g.164 Transcript_127/m.164 type:complete len:105 (+) Transcript_127:68-382(+)
MHPLPFVTAIQTQMQRHGPQMELKKAYSSILPIWESLSSSDLTFVASSGVLQDLVDGGALVEFLFLCEGYSSTIKSSDVEIPFSHHKTSISLSPSLYIEKIQSL